MDTLEMKQKLYEYIDVVDDEKVAALYDSIKAETAGRYEWWNDDKMVAELERRADDMDNGKDKGFTKQESRERILAKLDKNA